MSYYITGDCHADFKKLIYFAKYNKELTEDDVIILLGDVGLNYFGKKKDDSNKALLNQFPNYFLCIHGNHEERPFNIPTYKTKNWHGGIVYYESEFPYILFAKDGEIYDFDGKKVIVIGGAYSRDKEYRILTGLPWFQDEQPGDELKKQVEKKLNHVKWKVDYVLSHTCPLVYRPRQMTESRQIDYSTEEWLDEIAGKLKYSKWYFGHYHENIQYTDAELLFEEIKELGKDEYLQKLGRPKYQLREEVYFLYGKNDAHEGYGIINAIEEYGSYDQKKEVSYDITGIDSENPNKKELFKHIEESKIQSIDEMKTME